MAMELLQALDGRSLPLTVKDEAVVEQLRWLRAANFITAVISNAGAAGRPCAWNRPRPAGPAMRKPTRGPARGPARAPPGSRAPARQPLAGRLLREVDAPHGVGLWRHGLLAQEQQRPARLADVRMGLRQPKG